MTLNEGLEHVGTYLFTTFIFDIPPSRYVTFVAEFAQVISTWPAYARVKEDVERWFTPSDSDASFHNLGWKT